MSTPDRPDRPERRHTTVIARTVTRTVVPLIVVTSIALFLQGHNLPGGGFIAGVLTTTAFALVYIIYGLDHLPRELLGRTIDRRGPITELVETYTTVAGAGLGLAAGSGVVAMAFGEPFLTQTVTFLHGLPIYGEVEVASAVAFDLGVYLLVVGALLVILTVVGAE